ncbi:SelB C-terminal domain-containing protein [Kibdelosporangium lantanae]|uniref:SelB C-terminal domain-containing protein n=1 Tax=Kibdelosporangium lantanae TaxID=1497396 RepID=A0ABW3M071_9PSEU
MGQSPGRSTVQRLLGVRRPGGFSDARRALNTSRRVAIPLLEHLDQAGHTRQTPDGRHLT